MGTTSADDQVLQHLFGLFRPQQLSGTTANVLRHVRLVVRKVRETHAIYLRNCFHASSSKRLWPPYLL